MAVMKFTLKKHPFKNVTPHHL